MKIIDVGNFLQRIPVLFLDLLQGGDACGMEFSQSVSSELLQLQEWAIVDEVVCCEETFFRDALSELEHAEVSFSMLVIMG